MLERELPRLSTNEKRHPPNGILQILQEIKKKNRRKNKVPASAGKFVGEN
jgi:hypothetical protein